MKLLIYGFSFLLFFLCSEISFAQTATDKSSASAEAVLAENKKRASDLLRDGKPTRAYEAFMRLLREHPLDGEVNLGVARSAYASKRYNQAIMAYERLIESYPDKAFLHIELAAVYVALRNPENARLELGIAKGLDPLLNSIELEDIIRAEEDKLKHWFINGNITIGYGFDSNANSGPYSSKIVLGNFPVILDKASTQQSSEFGQTIAGLNLVYRNNRQSRLLFVSDVAFYGKYYIKDSVRDNNLLWTRLALGFRYHWTSQYIDFRVKGDFAQYPTTRNITTAGAELNHGVIVNNLVSFIGRAAYEQRFYTDSPGNDGFYYNVGETLRLGFLNGTQNLMIGVKFAQRKAENPMFSNLAGEGSLQGAFSVPWSVTISPFLSYRHEWYDGPGTVLELVNRMDGQIRTGISVTKNFNKNFFVDLTYQYVKNLSTSPIYRYDQHIATISLGAQF